MSIDLKRVADIYTGFTIRESVSYLDYGDTKLLQSKDLPNEEYVINDTSELSSIDWRYDSDPQYLKKGSVVLLARGTPKAYVFNGDINDRVTAGHIFIIINITSEILTPEYLAWYINNSGIARKHFEINSSGSVLNMTSISTVRELPVLVPSLSEQKEINKRNRQTWEDIQVLKQMIELRKEQNHAYNEKMLSSIQSNQSELN